MSSPSLTQITTPSRSVQPKNGPVSINEAIAQGTFDAVGAVHSAYLHVPFCFHKCHYCDFYSIVDNRDRQVAFTARLIDEIAAASAYISPPLDTIFIGGGTPTLLEPDLWRQLLRAIDEHIHLSDSGEFTVEANPETVTPELAGVLRSGGVNRISVGCQSFNPRHLKTLERWHDPANVHRSVEILRSAGLENVNLDLIFAIPGQTLDEWLNDLDEALSLKPTHLSCYGLVYEPNTALTIKMKSGAITAADQELEAQMYRATMERLAAAGFEHYEISNFAQIQNPKSKVQNSARCRHNMEYWTNRNWWPLGPSASGHVNGTRWKNVARLGEYLDSGPLPPITDFERVDEDSRIGEEFMLGLRLIEGLPLARVEELLSRGGRSSQRRDAIQHHLAQGLLERTGDRLRLRPEGIMLADTVLAELI